jgi:hypothetical protein
MSKGAAIVINMAGRGKDGHSGTGLISKDLHCDSPTSVLWMSKEGLTAMAAV